MPYDIEGKDGRLIRGVPDDVSPDDAIFTELFAKLRASGEKEGPFSIEQSNNTGDVYQVGKTSIQDAQSPTSSEKLNIDEQVANFAKSLNAQREKENSENQNMLGKVKDIFTGDSRKTAETEQLDDIRNLPELHNMSLKSLQSAFVGLTGDEYETARAIVKNFPGTSYRLDDKDNVIIKSKENGKEYVVNKPGIDALDLTKAAITAGIFAGGGEMGILGKMGLSALKQAGIEATQLASGGEVDPMQVVMAPVAEAAASGIGSIVKGAKSIWKGTIKGVEEGIANLSAKHGVDVHTSDIFPPSTASGKMANAIGKKIPFTGTADGAIEQQAQRQSAVRSFLDEYDAPRLTGGEVNQVTEDLLKTRKSKIDFYKGIKDSVIENIDKNSRNPKSVDVTDSLFEIEKKIRKLRSMKIGSVQPLIEKLRDYSQSFQNQNLGNVESLRKLLSDELKEPSLAHIRSTGEKMFPSIYRKLRKDMLKHVEENASKAEYDAYKTANMKLSKMSGELNNSRLKAALDKGEVTPEIVNSALFSSRPSDIKLLYHNLSDAGKKNAKLAFVHEIVDRSGGIDKITPADFVKQMNRFRKTYGVVFSKEEQAAGKGLVKLLDITKRAEKDAAVPGAASQISIFAAPAVMSSFAGPGAFGITAAALGIGGLARAYESKVMRNFLIRVNSAGKGKEQEIIKQLPKVMQVARQRMVEK